jgi:hypothetical protein
LLNWKEVEILRLLIAKKRTLYSALSGQSGKGRRRPKDSDGQKIGQLRRVRAEDEAACYSRETSRKAMIGPAQ